MVCRLTDFSILKFKRSFLLQLLHGTILTQGQVVVGGSDKDSDQKIIDLANSIAVNIPNLFDVIEAAEKYPTKYEQSMNTVLRQVRLNRLTARLFRIVFRSIIIFLVVYSKLFSNVCSIFH